MSTYVYMVVLESSPERYDRGIHWLSVVEPSVVRSTRLSLPGRRSVALRS